MPIDIGIKPTIVIVLQTFKSSGSGIVMKESKRLQHRRIFWQALVCIASAVSFGCSGQAPIPSDQGQSIAENFLAMVRSGKSDDAWAGTSAEFKSLLGKDSFRNYVRQNPALKSVSVFKSASPVENNQMKFVECIFTTSGAKPTRIKILLAPSSETWLVERISID